MHRLCSHLPLWTEKRGLICMVISLDNKQRFSHGRRVKFFDSLSLGLCWSGASWKMWTFNTSRYIWLCGITILHIGYKQNKKITQFEFYAAHKSLILPILYLKIDKTKHEGHFLPFSYVTRLPSFTECDNKWQHANSEILDFTHFRNLQKAKNPGSLRVTLVKTCVQTFLELQYVS